MSSNSPQKVIGVIGGLGPSAGVDLCQRFLTYSQKKYQAVMDWDYPHFILNSLNMTGFDETGIADYPHVLAGMTQACKALEGAGADFIVMACNTIHAMLPELQQQVKIPFISMIAEAGKAVQAAGFTKIGLVCSETTSRLNLYQKVFSDLGIEVVAPIEEQQPVLNDVIEAVMGNTQGDKEKTALREIMQYQISQGAQAIVLGCTELPLAIDQSDCPEWTVFDTLQIIAEAAVEEARR